MAILVAEKNVIQPKNSKSSIFLAFSWQWNKVVHQKFKLHQMGHQKAENFHHLTFRAPVFLKNHHHFPSRPTKYPKFEPQFLQICRKFNPNVTRSENFADNSTHKTKPELIYLQMINKKNSSNPCFLASVTLSKAQESFPTLLPSSIAFWFPVFFFLLPVFLSFPFLSFLYPMAKTLWKPPHQFA